MSGIPVLSGCGGLSSFDCVGDVDFSGIPFSVSFLGSSPLSESALSARTGDVFSESGFSSDLSPTPSSVFVSVSVVTLLAFITVVFFLMDPRGDNFFFGFGFSGTSKSSSQPSLFHPFAFGTSGFEGVLSSLSDSTISFFIFLKNYNHN